MKVLPSFPSAFIGNPLLGNDVDSRFRGNDIRKSLTEFNNNWLREF